MAVVVGRVGRPGGHLPQLDQLTDFLPFADPVASSAKWSARGNESDLTAFSWGAPGDRAIARSGGCLLAVDGSPVHSDAELIHVITGARYPEIGELRGAFAAVIIDGETLFAYSSAGGDFPLFWAQDSGGLIISSRAAVPVGATRPAIDEQNVIHMFTEGFFPSGIGMFKGVRQLLPGDRLRVSRTDSGLVVNVDCPDVGDLIQASHRTKPRARAEIAEECIASAAESLRHSPDAALVSLRLSGGRDSRAVLSLMAAAGVADRIDGIVTTGPLFSTDVISARAVAAACGLADRHRIQQPKLDFGGGDLARAAVSCIASTGSALSLFDHASDILNPARLTFNGHETALKTSGLSQYPVDDFAKFARLASRYGLDPAGILTRGAREELAETRVATFAALRDQRVPTDRLAEVVNWRQRGGGWVGASLSPHRAANRHFNPLMDPALIKLTFSLPRICSEGELIPFLLTARSPVDLVDLPFAGHPWPPGLGQALDAVDMGRLAPKRVAAFGTPGPIRSHFRPWITPRRGALLRSLVPVLRELAAAHASLVPGLDRKALDVRLEEVSAGAPVNPLADIALTGLATVLITAEYGAAIFGRSTRSGVVDSLAERMAGIEDIDDPQTIIEVYRGEISMRDAVLAEFVKEDQARAAVRAGRLPWLPPRARRVGGKMARRLGVR